MAQLRLLQQPGAGSWLPARPAEALGLALEPHFSRVCACASASQLHPPRVNAPCATGLRTGVEIMPAVAPVAGIEANATIESRTVLAERPASPLRWKRLAFSLPSLLSTEGVKQVGGP